MILYESGAMTGYPQHNFALFRLAAKDLRRRGHIVTSPHELDEDSGLDHGESPDGLTCTDDEYAALLGRDKADIASGRFDGIVFLPGWERSGGAGQEGVAMEEAGGQAFLWAPWVRDAVEPLSWAEFFYRSTTERVASVPEEAAR